MPVLFLERIPLPSLRTYFSFSICAFFISALRFLYELRDDELLVKISNFRIRIEDVPSFWEAVSNRVMNDAWCFWTLVNIAYCLLISIGAAIEIIVFGQLRIAEQEHIRDKFWNFVFYKFIFVFGVMNVQMLEGVVLWFTWFSALGFLQLHTHLSKDRFDYLVQLCSAAVNRPASFWSSSPVVRTFSDSPKHSSSSASRNQTNNSVHGLTTANGNDTNDDVSNTQRVSQSNALRYRHEIEKVIALLCCIFVLLCALLACSYVISVYESGNQAVFMATECVLQMFTVVYIIVKYVVFVRRLNFPVDTDSVTDAESAAKSQQQREQQFSEPSWGANTKAEYYVDLVFDLLSLAIEIGHHLHMLIWSQIIVSMANLIVCMQLRYLYYELQKRVVRHTAHLRSKRMLASMPLRSVPESESLPRCAICWEHASRLRELPCAHAYHDTCVRLWLQQELACPICRASLVVRFAEIRLLDWRALCSRMRSRFALLFGSASARIPLPLPQLPQLPVRLPALSLPQLLPTGSSPDRTFEVFGLGFDDVTEAARYIHSLLPQASVQAIRYDLLHTNSAEITIERLLDGELSGASMHDPAVPSPYSAVHFPCSPMQIALGATSSTLTDFVHNPVCGGPNSSDGAKAKCNSSPRFVASNSASPPASAVGDKPSSSRASSLNEDADKPQCSKAYRGKATCSLQTFEERKADLIRVARSRYLEKHGRL